MNQRELKHNYSLMPQWVLYLLSIYLSILSFYLLIHLSLWWHDTAQTQQPKSNESYFGRRPPRVSEAFFRHISDTIYIHGARAKTQTTSRRKEKRRKMQSGATRFKTLTQILKKTKCKKNKSNIQSISLTKTMSTIDLKKVAACQAGCSLFRWLIFFSPPPRKHETHCKSKLNQT